MRNSTRIFFLILLALVSVLLGVKVASVLMPPQPNPDRLPHALSAIPTVTQHGASKHPNLDGKNTTDQILDGTLSGVNLEELKPLLGKPCAQWYYPFILAGWDKSEWSTARWVIYRESRCLQYAYNGEDAGLMQINYIHAPLVKSLGLVFPDSLFDGETNLWVANVLWSEYGWEPWIFKGVIPGE